MYLQDRVPERTRAGAASRRRTSCAGRNSVAVAGDNCRDAFYAYGDHDMVDTFRQAVRILHLDHPFADAPAMASVIPASIIDCGPIDRSPRCPARMILFNARSLNEIVCGRNRPHRDRSWASRSSMRCPIC